MTTKTSIDQDADQNIAPPTKIISDQFATLQVKYNLKTPEQIQMSIIWHHLKQLSVNAFGDSPENNRILNSYDAHWRLCETMANEQSEVSK